MEHKHVDRVCLETAMSDFGSLTIQGWKCRLPIPGDTLPMVGDPNPPHHATYWVPEAPFLEGAPSIKSLAQSIQQEYCSNVRDQGGQVLLQYACPKGASAEILEDTWETDLPAAKCHDDDSDNRRGPLPLHTLLKLDQRQPSLASVQVLVEDFPQALGMTDAANCLPLHYACWNENMSLEIIRYLVSRYPSAVWHRGGPCNEIPLWYAVESHLSLDILIWLIRPSLPPLRQQAVFSPTSWLWLSWSKCLERAMDYYTVETIQILLQATHQAHLEVLLTQQVAWLDQRENQLEELFRITRRDLDDSDNLLHPCVVPVLHWIRSRKQPLDVALRNVTTWWNNLTNETRHVHEHDG
jgi:hypothetical protein